MPSSKAELSQFFGAYFHQDWVDEHSSWEQVAEHYAKDSGPLLTRLVASAVAKLSEAPISEKELSAQVQALGCYYWPGTDEGYRSWLRELAAHMLVLAANHSLQSLRP
ncbi:contact-dependent growth inhibition system immunity protein [Shewanella cyperi]|uniref:contact-dependent growth inhibition system immunity protein n=1 Tax=Shewanella cyperi TaxID=2814292 RepID=UPI001A94737F|nr:hypothetical protein JYB84_02830 [Shewanella cyperi]